jgi:hypothetical protein
LVSFGLFYRQKREIFKDFFLRKWSFDCAARGLIAAFKQSFYSINVYTSFRMEVVACHVFFQTVHKLTGFRPVLDIVN